MALSPYVTGLKSIIAAALAETRDQALADISAAETVATDAITTARDDALADVSAEGAVQVGLAAAQAGLAATSAALIPNATGIGSADVAATVRGVVTPTTSPASASASWSTGKSFPYDGTMATRVRCTASGTYQCAVVDMPTRKPLKVFTGIALSSGLNTLGASVFGDYVRPAGTLLFFDQTAGSGGISYDAGGVSLSSTTQSFIVGTPINAYTTPAVTLAIEETVTAVPATLNRRVAMLERASAGWGKLRTRTTGTLTLGSSADAANTSLFYEFLSTDPCILDKFEFDMTAAGSGYLAFDIRNGDGTVSPYMVWPVDAVPGVNEVNFGGLNLPGGCMVGYRALIGAGAKYQNGIGHCFSRSVLTAGIGESVALLSTQVRMAYRATLREPSRRKRVFPRRAYGPVPVVSETFPGVAVTPEGWTLGAAFSISDGLVMSGAGGWSNVATFNASGGRSSSISKRIVFAEITITDPTWIGGVCTQVQTGNGSAGCVATVDCPAGKLYLHSWTGSGTAGAFLAGSEVNLPASTLAAIGAASTSIPLVVKLEKNGATVTATATDPVTGNSAAITETLNATTQAALRLMHGKPGMMHRQGAAKAKYFGAVHNVPFDCGTAIAGDSNAEGIYGDTLNTWAQQAVAASPRVVLSARGSATTAEMLERIDDILSVRADRWVLALGTNETAQATWRVNMASLIDLVRATGAEPILTTFPPNENSGAQTIMNALNADVLANYFGVYRYIDFAAALSSGNARTAWNGAYRRNNNHSNQAGQNVAYAQAQINVPDFLL